MREVLPATPAAEQADAALNLLQLNYTDNDHPFSVRSVLPYMRLVHDSPEALAEYVSPMTVSNKAAIWLQLKAEPDAQAAVHTTLPDAVDNRYYQTLFDHVKHGAEVGGNLVARYGCLTKSCDKQRHKGIGSDLNQVT